MTGSNHPRDASHDDPLAAFISPDELDRYLAGMASPEERARMAVLCETHPALREQLDALQSAIVAEAQCVETHSPMPSATDALARVRERLRETSTRDQRRVLGRGTPLSPTFGKIAVGVIAFSVVLVAIVGLGRMNSRATRGAVQSYQTVSGQRSTVHLPDGSMMTLAPSTTVTMTGQELTVSGEAFFSVISHADHPFIVRTRNAVVRVLGTRFSVRQYSEESRSHVAVEDGRVTVRAVNDGIQRDKASVLSARMLGVVTDSGVTVTSGAVGDYMGWAHGILVLSDVTLGDAVKDLSRAYGYDIRVADSALARRHVRMEVSVSELSLSRVLELIGMATDAHYTRDGKSYVLVPGRNVTRPEGLDPQRPRYPQPEKQYGR